jgi:hypothetical protein
MKKHYFVRAVWDDEAKTYYTESGIHGLFIETPSPSRSLRNSPLILAPS